MGQRETRYTSECLYSHLKKFGKTDTYKKNYFLPAYMYSENLTSLSSKNTCANGKKE